MRRRGSWLLADHDELWSHIEREPVREEVDAAVDEKLIVESYSR